MQESQGKNNSTEVSCDLNNDLKGNVGDHYTEDCVKFTCIKGSKKAGVWSEGPAM